jgi:UDP-N-acetylmuramyl-tripeptide synthetase
MDRYWACKKRLFIDYLKSSDADHPVRAVINGDDPKGRELAQIMGAAALRTATHGDGEVLPLSVDRDLAGTRGSIITPNGKISFTSALVGAFNLDNILSAAGAALTLGISPAAIAAGIHATPCIPGRLERIVPGGERTIFVDYAHTPNALENAIAALRMLAPNRLITVFGCGGDRDNHKRPMMGEIAARLSDLVVVTSDNPRSENPLRIIAQVEAGVKQVCTRRLSSGNLNTDWQAKTYVVEPDRMGAIGLAIRAAGADDAVLIAGKGHETYQILADKTIPFDDREVARQVLATIHAAGA